jgi:small subunit ribosomal protein S8
MALTDPIADMLTIIRNASSTKKEAAEVKGSVLSENIIKIMVREGFLANYKPIKDNKQGVLRVYLKYMKNGTPAILGLKRISRPGLRAYKSCEELPKVYGGLGMAVISTSKGLLTDNEARDKKVGGEVLFYIW